MYNSVKVNKLQEPELTERESNDLLRAAQNIYDTYYRLHSKVTKDPLGVAINPKTGHGQLLFTKKPILLPEEQFIPLRLLSNAKQNNRFSTS